MPRTGSYVQRYTDEIGERTMIRIVLTHQQWGSWTEAQRQAWGDAMRTVTDLIEGRQA
jgi:hypothetical protein